MPLGFCRRDLRLPVTLALAAGSGVVGRAFGSWAMASAVLRVAFPARGPCGLGARSVLSPELVLPRAPSWSPGRPEPWSSVDSPALECVGTDPGRLPPSPPNAALWGPSVDSGLSGEVEREGGRWGRRHTWVTRTGRVWMISDRGRGHQG